MRSAILRALAMSWVIESAVAPSSLHAFDDQVVDDVGHDRVEPGRRLVEEDDLGLGAMARARPTRFCMPPDSSAGRQRRRPRRPGRPRRASPARSPWPAARSMPRPWIRPKATFSQTRQRVEQRRALEQHAELAHQPRRARRARRPTVSCAVDLDRCRRRAASRPRMHLSSTDLPVPEPPMMTRLSPAPTVEIDAVEHDASARTASCRPLHGDLRRPALAHRREEHLGHDVVEDEDQDRGGDDGIGRRLRRRPAAPPREW